MYENCYQALMVFPDAEVDAVVERLRAYRGRRASAEA